MYEAGECIPAVPARSEGISRWIAYVTPTSLIASRFSHQEFLVPKIDHARFQSIIKRLYELVSELEEMFPGRPFTPDGHMVGSIGETLVADAFNLELMPPSNEGFDAKSQTGTKVEIKATQGRTVAFRSCPQHTIIIRIEKDGTFETFFDGPGELIWKQFDGKKTPKNGQFQISLTKVRRLNESVVDDQRIVN
jgi:hypothetical protein